MRKGGLAPSFSFLFVGKSVLYVGCPINLTPIIYAIFAEFCTFALATGQVIGGGAPMSEKVCE